MMERIERIRMILRAMQELDLSATEKTDMLEEMDDVLEAAIAEGEIASGSDLLTRAQIGAAPNEASRQATVQENYPDSIPLPDGNFLINRDGQFTLNNPPGLDSGDVAAFARPIVQTAAAIPGAILGTPGGPGGMASGAALTSQIGGQAYDLAMQQLAGTRDVRSGPEQVLDAATEMSAEAAIPGVIQATKPVLGAAANLAGRGIGKAQRFAGDTVRNITDYINTGTQAKRDGTMLNQTYMGGGMTPGQVSTSPMQITLENQARQSPYTADMMRMGVDEPNAMQFRGMLEEARGPQVVTDEVGNAARIDMEETAGLLNVQAGAEFDNWVTDATRDIGDDVIPLTSYQSELGRLIQEYSEKGTTKGAAVANELRQMVSLINARSEDALQNWHAKRSAMSQATAGGDNIFAKVRDPDGTETKYVAGQLIDALDDDFINYARTTGKEYLIGSFEAARTSYARDMRTFELLSRTPIGRFMGKKLDDLNAGFEDVFTTPGRRVISALLSSQVDDAMVKNSMKALSPETQQQVKALVYELALEAGQPTIMMGTKQSFRPSGASKELDKIGNERLQALGFNDADISFVNDLKEIGRRLADPQGTNFSNTAVTQEVQSMQGTDAPGMIAATINVLIKNAGQREFVMGLLSERNRDLITQIMRETDPARLRVMQEKLNQILANITGGGKARGAPIYTEGTVDQRIREDDSGVGALFMSP